MKHTVTNPCGILLTEEKEVTVIGCPGFLCPCLPENSNDIAINIDAAGGLDITNTVLDAMAINFPAQWGTNYNQVNGRCLAINGQLIIPTNSNSQLSFDEIHMQPGSEILVKTGAELFPSKFNLEGNVIDGCFQMWRGITVENEAVFTSIFTTIRDAQYAVTLGRSTISSAFTFFENNHVGIRTLNNGPLNVVTTGFFPFSGNTFNQAGNLLPYFNAIPHYNMSEAYAGIELERTVWNDIGSMGGSPNIFSNIRNGILATGAGAISVFNGQFNSLLGNTINLPNMPPSDNLRGIGIYAASSNSLGVVQGCTFNTVSRGISAVQSNLFNVQENRFLNVRSGVIASENNSLTFNVHDNNPIEFFNFGIGNYTIASGATTINDNTLTFLDTGAGPVKSAAITVEAQIPTAPETVRREINYNVLDLQGSTQGIVISNDDRYEVQYNVIGYTGQHSKTSGIRLNNSNFNFLHTNDVRGPSGVGIGLKSFAYRIDLSSNNTYCCNFSDRTDIGWQFTGGCDGSFWRHSVVTQHNEGLTLLTTGAVIGEQRLAGNRWAGTYTVHSARNFGNPLASTFFVELPATPPFWPLNPIPATNWFFPDQTGGSSGFCGIESDTICPAPIQGPEKIHPNDSWYATSSTGGDAFEDAMVWEGRYDLYRRLVANPDLQLESTDFQNFHDAQSSSPMGKLLRVDSELQNLMAIDPATSTAIQSYDAQLQSLTSQLNDLDGQLALAPTLADTLQLMADRQVLLSSLAIVSDNLAQLYESLGSLDLVALNNIRAINSSFTSSHPVEQTAQQVYQLLFDFLEDKSTLDNPTDLLELRSLAELCPFTHGHYIYTARAMMQHFDETFEVVTETCSGINLNQPPPQAFTKDQATGGLTVYPNPSKDEIKVSCDTGREIAIIVVKDLNGRELWRGDFERATSINISDWADGIYFLSVMQLGKPTQTIKFTCLR